MYIFDLMIVLEPRTVNHEQFLNKFDTRSDSLNTLINLFYPGRLPVGYRDI